MTSTCKNEDHFKDLVTDGICNCPNVMEAEVSIKDGITIHTRCGGKNPIIKIKKEVSKK